MYRTEHPKPQMQRKDWQNLNGPWEFLIDTGLSVEPKERYRDPTPFPQIIEVPFCPQSPLSRINYSDYLFSVWYRRKVQIVKDKHRGRVFLHFGAVDYTATVYINGVKVGGHRGGYVSFRIEITDYVKDGENVIVVHAEDDERNSMIPSGKQSGGFFPGGCMYTRTTGIWQTVWLEFTPESYIDKVKMTPLYDSQSLMLAVDLVGEGSFTATASFKGKKMGQVKADAKGGQLLVSMPLDELYPWELGKGNLYDLTLTYNDDVITSYFGMRKIEYRDKKFFLNGKSVFQRLVLDQGFFPDGLYTAPSDEELCSDVERSMAMGFNGGRLHQKVFEERFLYHADRLGYLVWGEYPNWGLDHSKEAAIYGMLPEWLEEVERDYNHPSIVGWCPFNETWDQNGHRQYDGLISAIYYATKAADPTRPCIDVSGNYHVVTDVYDVHDYDQDPVSFDSHYRGLATDGSYVEYAWQCQERQKYDGKAPFFVSEYGGIRFTEDPNGWGYGNAPASREEFLERLSGLTHALLSNPGVFAYCYTQLTDIEQEQNGLYTYDRKPKFPPSEIYPILAEKAAVEE